MKKSEVSKATLGRIPKYVRYLKSLPKTAANISATTIAKALGLGEVQVRKDLSSLCGSGKPKIGYPLNELIESLEGCLGFEDGNAVIIGAGKLGRALLDYEGFSSFGISIQAAFDTMIASAETSAKGKPILTMDRLASFCKANAIKIGIITVPAESAQAVCDMLYKNGIRAVWCFAPCQLCVPSDTIIQYENLALSLAHLKMQIN